MSIDDRQQHPDPALIRQLIGEQISEALSPHAWASVAAREPDRPLAPEPSPARSRIVLIAVAASLVALIVGLVVVGARGESTAPADTAARPAVPTPVPLADVTDIAVDQWVIPAELPGEMEFQYAMRTGASRSVRAGTDAEPERLIIHLDSPAATSTAASEVVIGGRTWAVISDLNGWNASPLDGTPAVLVHGAGLFDTDAQQFLEALQVVPTELLPYPPLDLDGPMTEVADYDYDGERWVLQVQEANGYFCSRLTNSGGGSGECGGLAPAGSDVFLSVGGGGGYDYEDGSSMIRVNGLGIVRDDVALVEVEFIDGSVVTVAPVNRTDRFEGLRFWVVVADVDLAEDQPFDGLTPVEEVRAFDAAGELLDTQRPGGG